MDDADMISDLPESMIHHIMSFLSPRDAIRISILSKKFFSAWKSFPVLCFDSDLFARTLRSNISSWEKTDLFLNSVRRSLRIRKLKGVRLERLIFYASLGGFESSDSRVDEMLNYAKINGVRDLSLVDSKFNQSPRGPKPYSFRMDRSIFSANSIVKLNLEGFELKPKYITLNFPSAEKFSLSNCCGFKSIKLSGEKLNHVKIDFCIGLQKIHIHAPKSLESFSYEMDLSSCESVRFFEWRNVTVGDEWRVESKFSWLRRLEKLKLVRCFFPYKVDLYFENLKSLEIIQCDGNAQFEAPNLVSFKYCGSLTMNTPLLISNDGLHADLYFDSHDTVSFLKRMRDFIRSFSFCQTLSLNCVFDKDLICVDKMREIPNPPSYNIKHLKIAFHYKVKSLVKLVDSLLWLVPHPNTITITRKHSQVVQFIKFDYKEPMVEFVCQQCQSIKCWLHNLKDVILKNFEDEECTSLYNTFFNK